MSNPAPRPAPKTAFITGANGYIGHAVARAFLAAGYRTFGLVRRESAVKDLAVAEITPVVGTLDDLSFLDTQVYPYADRFDVIVNATEVVGGYAKHFEQSMQLVRTLAKRSLNNGVRPLVLWSTGCKDYGQTGFHGDADLAPHTEESPVTGLGIIKERAESCQTVFHHKDLFDAALLFPTNVYGYTSSYWAAFLQYAAEQAKGRKVLTFAGNPNTISHGMHVDDCAAAYVALAEHADRGAVAAQSFNISAYRYETSGEIADALAAEYGMEEARWVPLDQAPEGYPPGLLFGMNWSQWVSSDKIRRVTGWSDKRALLTEDLKAYRRSYEAFEAAGHDNITVIKERMDKLFEGMAK
ncbi:putative NAD dependent epimerase/dehydratase [Stachybotrys elegans]|uniref:NAD dependent epimerase/dehydratase n=1 Tax=Stachybotrys elegans TaxID=80388 RepID=A0A8K0T633_9HYPO|nr:putative NAD dependent epimerase/dehydratase [Stachybotrys elegans]